jgi:two-component system, LytTR family, response regulator AlgR
MPDNSAIKPLRTLIVDDEPLALERMAMICRDLPAIEVAGTAQDGADALRQIGALAPDLVLLDMTMPELDGLGVAQHFAAQEQAPVVIFVTAHDHFAVEAFDLEAVDYVLKPVSADRLERAIERAVARRGQRRQRASRYLDELWVPHRSELLRIAVSEVHQIDAERDYVRLHVGGPDAQRSYLLLQTIAGLEERLDPEQFIRIHRSTILRRDHIRGLRHDGLGVWSAELEDGTLVRIGRTYLAKAKAMAGR